MASLQTLLARGTTAADSDRRGEHRYPISNPVSVQLKVPPASEIIEAQVVDVSKNGIGLVAKSHIIPGVQIVFRFGEQNVFARVRHCRPGEGGFVIGATIADVVANDGEPGA
jgi:hypothetical protein